MIKYEPLGPGTAPFTNNKLCSAMILTIWSLSFELEMSTFSCLA